MTTRGILTLITVAALALRCVLAFAFAPGTGYAPDIDAFYLWVTGLGRDGVGGFYAGTPTANYPPLALYALWLAAPLGSAVGPLLGYTAAEATLGLLKLPAILAEVACVPLAAALATRLRDQRAGVVAAALTAFTPVLWYTSSLWGQIDGLLGFLALLAVWLIVVDAPELACAAAICAVMVKPQGILVVLVIAAVVLSRFRFEPVRLVTSTLVAAGVLCALLLPFDLQRLAPPGLGGIPIVGDLAGWWQQSVSTGALFPVLSADAYNAWALGGPRSLVDTIGTGTAIWTPDSWRLFGVPAHWVGLAALVVALSAVVFGLWRRDDDEAVLFGYVVASFALFGLPTRVHERYLVPAFPVMAVLAAVSAWWLAGFLLTSTANLINLHAVLANRLELLIDNGDGTGTQVGSDRTVPSPGSAGSTSGGPGGPEPGGGSGGGSGGTSAGQIELPWGQPAVTDQMATVVSVGLSAASLLLLVAWLVFVRRTD